MSWCCCFLLFVVFISFSEMDFSKFSDENFDVKEWVNSALRIRDDRTPVDVSSGLQRVHVQLLHDDLLCQCVCVQA